MRILYAVIFASFLMICFIPATVKATDYYVDQSVSASGDGLSWATATRTILESMILASAGDAVHVAEGKYKETVIVGRSVTLMGGYPAGGGTRDFRAHVTIIDAGLPKPSQPAVTMKDESTIDGFTIMNGNGLPTMIYSTHGGGIHCGEGPVIIRNNIITENAINSIEGAYGGGIYVFGSTAEIYNNIISFNQVTGMGGGSAVFVWNSTVNIYNNFIYGNACDGSSLVSRGAVTFRESGGNLYNNTVGLNKSADQGGICLTTSSPEIYNNIIHENTGYGVFESDTTSDPPCYYNNFYENTLGVYFDENMTAYSSATSLNTAVPEARQNIDCNPSFLAPADYHIALLSCCIDAGTNTGAPLWDLDGETRPAGLKTDIGCDEVQQIQVPVTSYILLCLLPLILLCMVFQATHTRSPKVLDS